MNYYNKLQKYLGKVNYAGGANRLHIPNLTLANLDDYQVNAGGGGATTYHNGFQGYCMQSTTTREERMIVWLNGNWYLLDEYAIRYAGRNNIRLTDNIDDAPSGFSYHIAAPPEAQPEAPPEAPPEARHVPDIAVPDDIFAEVHYVAPQPRMPPREYRFKKDGYKELEECIVDIGDNWLPRETPADFVIDRSGIKNSDRSKFDNMINVLKKFNSRFDEIWNELYTVILESSGLFYDENYQFNPADNTKYGLLILKSIYDVQKTVKKFKDGDDICIYGYSPHSKRQCRNFNGIRQDKLTNDLLHWPNKLCDLDQSPAKKAVLKKDARGNVVLFKGKPVYESYALPPGCSDHIHQICTFLHIHTIITHPDASKKQIDFQLVAHNPEHNVSPVVYYIGFKTLPLLGKWYRDKPFTNKAEPQCKFDDDDFVKIIGDLEVVQTRLQIPTFRKDWISKITKLNYNASYDCTSARVKIARLYSKKYNEENEIHGAPAINDIDITSDSLRANGLTSFIYFRTIDIVNLESTDAPAPEPVYALAPVPAPAPEEEAPEPELTEDRAKEKIRKTLATIQRSIISYQTEVELLDRSKYLRDEKNRLNKLAVEAIRKIPGDKKEQVQSLIELIISDLDTLSAKATDLDTDIPKFVDGLKRVKDEHTTTRAKFENPAIPKLALYAELFTPNSLVLRALNNVPVFIEKRLKRLRMELQKFIIDTKKRIEDHIAGITIYKFK